jgi:glutathione S-transferase
MLTGSIAAGHSRRPPRNSVKEQRLSSSAWLAAGRYTIADIALYAYTQTAADGGFDLRPIRVFARGSTGCVRNPDTFRRCRKSRACRSSNGRADPVPAYGYARTG